MQAPDLNGSWTAERRRWDQSACWTHVVVLTCGWVASPLATSYGAGASEWSAGSWGMATVPGLEGDTATPLLRMQGATHVRFAGEAKYPATSGSACGVHAATHGMTKRAVLIRALSAYLLHNGGRE